MTTDLKELLPKIKARRAEIEQARRIPDDLAASLRDTGIFALGVPRALGGEETPPADTARVVETIAEADGSTGWVSMIGISSGQAAGYMQEAGAKEAYADPTAPLAALAGPIGKFTREDGGLRVSGRWSFASGIDHCEWIWVGGIVFSDGAPVMTEHGPEIHHVTLPVAEGEVIDTWHVSGLRGTGSNDFVVNDVFVPEQHVWSLFDPSGHRPEPLYQMPVVSVFVGSTLAPVALGIARAALNELTELAQTKVPPLSMAVLADRAAGQIDVARAEARLSAARAFLYDAIDDMWETVLVGREPTMRQRALVRMAAVNAVETGAEVARTCNVLAGGGALYDTSDFQRHARDAEAMLHHFTVSQHTWEDAGRALLGRAPLAPIF
jgi:alkylation response protein AidB-like acyl-CoA dehydrogenase